MRILSALLTLTLVVPALQAQGDSLSVLAHAPGDTAESGNLVRIIFDRPVAGRLGATVDASRHFAIAPAVAGKVSWRDPITMQFLPAQPFAPGDSFTVTIDTLLTAMDGTRLAAPYRFTFRVPGARLLGRSFGSYYPSTAAAIPLSGKIQLLYSAPVDLELFDRGLSLTLTGCGTSSGSIAIRAARQRTWRTSDAYSLTSNYEWDRDTSADRFRRVVELETARPLPEGCTGSLEIPTTADDAQYGRTERYAVRTPVPFTLDSVACELGTHCSPDGFRLVFSARVKLEELRRHVHVAGAQPTDFAGAYNDLSGPSSLWRVKVRLEPRATYAVTIDSTLADEDGRRIRPPFSRTIALGDRLALVGYPHGFVMTPPSDHPTLPLFHVNVRSVRLITISIPDSVRDVMMRIRGSAWLKPAWLDSLHVRPESRFVVLPGALNVESSTDVPLPAAAGREGVITVVQVEIATTLDDYSARDSTAWGVSREGSRLVITRDAPWAFSPWAFVQATDLAVSAKLGAAGGNAYVTSLSSGRGRAGVTVRVSDARGAPLAEGRTDSAGLAALPALDPSAVDHIDAIVASDRVVLPATNRMIGFTPFMLDMWSLGARMGTFDSLHGTIFADRDLYRPGESVYLKALLRVGTLSDLHLPAARQVRLRLVSDDDQWQSDGYALYDSVLSLSDAGSISDSIRLRPGVPLGGYTLVLAAGGTAHWRTVATASLRIAEYRAPEFLVEAHADSAAVYGGDTLRVDASGRFLFGAPMGRAKVYWYANLHEAAPWEVHVPGSDGWIVGEWAWSERREADEPAPVRFGGTDSLDADGRTHFRVPLAGLSAHRPGRVEVQVAVADVNRQMVSATVSVPIHPARVYVLVRPHDAGLIWAAGRPASVDVRTVRPDGSPVEGVPVVIQAVHETFGSVARDTIVRTDTIRTSAAAAGYVFTPEIGGVYTLRFYAADGHGGEARTSLSGFVLSGGAGWGRVTPERLPLAASVREAAVGDIVPVTFQSPFDSADAWVTVERERVIEQRIVAAHAGANEVPIHIRSGDIPGVTISVFLVRRGELRARPDSASQRFRVGYIRIGVNSAPRRLSVTVAPEAREYRPGDTASIRVHVSDAARAEVSSEVTVWAVDEGVLSLTGYRVPDVLAQILAPFGVGARLWSSLPNTLTRDPWLLIQGHSTPLRLGEVVVTGAGTRQFTVPDAPLRKEFRSTAFFAGAVRTNARGDAVIRAALPDNLTTYRVMAVAASGSDLFGRGETSLVATRALVVRPSLPRFVRPADSVYAGAAVNVRNGMAGHATVTATAAGLRILGDSVRAIALSRGSGAEARFHFAVPAREAVPASVAIRFGAHDERFADAVETRLPVRPDFSPRSHASMGAFRGRITIDMDLPAGLDPVRSRVTIRTGMSPLAPMLAAYEWMRTYPYDCTEQVASIGRSLIAIARLRGRGSLDRTDRELLQSDVDKLVRRQRYDGAIKYWTDADWSSPWLSAYAGEFLLDARDEGLKYDPDVLSKLAEYLKRSLPRVITAGGANRYEQRDRRLALGDQVASVEFLRRAGDPAVASEDQLLALAPDMTWEDRLRLAELLASRPDRRTAARAIVDEAWRGVTPAGVRVDLPAVAYSLRDFPSHVAPAARLLSATLALNAGEQRLGALVATILQAGRAERGWVWSTQDYAAAIVALGGLAHDATAPRAVRVTDSDGRTVAMLDSTQDSAFNVPVAGMLEHDPSGRTRLHIKLSEANGDGLVYYAVTVTEIPLAAPVTPDNQGIVVERWYERLSDGQPVTALREGELVRVRLSITVPADRQFVALEDPLPAGLEPVDLSLRAQSTLDPFIVHALDPDPEYERMRAETAAGPRWQSWLYGNWDEGWWQPWDHKELHDDRVIYFARMLWKGSYSASYIARATTAGTFVRPPAHAEEMYNAALSGRSDGGRFEVAAGTP